MVFKQRICGTGDKNLNKVKPDSEIPKINPGNKNLKSLLFFEVGNPIPIAKAAWKKLVDARSEFKRVACLSGHIIMNLG